MDLVEAIKMRPYVHVKMLVQIKLWYIKSKFLVRHKTTIMAAVWEMQFYVNLLREYVQWIFTKCSTVSMTNFGIRIKLPRLVICLLGWKSQFQG